jgi:hypothetical protein
MTDHSFLKNKKYEMVNHNGKKVQDFSAAYAKAYNRALNGMVERRMRSAILAIGSYWFSAWVDAGQPDLNKLIAKPLSPYQRKKMEQEVTLYKAGKVVVLSKH